MARKKTSNEEQTTIRMPAWTMAAVLEMAEKENRSLNAQLVTLVQKALECSTPAPATHQPQPVQR